jgi:hypothetical protein
MAAAHRLAMSHRRRGLGSRLSRGQGDLKCPYRWQRRLRALRAECTREGANKGGAPLARSCATCSAWPIPRGVAAIRCKERPQCDAGLCEVQLCDDQMLFRV